jgi:surface protein
MNVGLFWISESIMVADIKPEIGFAGSVENLVAENAQKEKINCGTLDAHMYLTITVGEKTSLLKNCLKKYSDKKKNETLVDDIKINIDESWTWDIFGKDNSPVKIRRHYEAILPSGDYELVCPCTALKYSLTGVVLNDSNEIIAGKSLFLKGVTTASLSQAVTTNEYGGFVFDNLPAGDYTITVNRDDGTTYTLNATTRVYQTINYSLNDSDDLLTPVPQEEYDTFESKKCVLRLGDGYVCLRNGEYADIIVEDTALEDRTKVSNIRRNLYTDAQYKVVGKISDFKKVTLRGTFGEESMDYLFGSQDSLEEVDVTDLDSSLVTNMARLFDDCDNLKKLDLKGLEFDNVTDMSQMFAGCENLLYVEFSDEVNTSKVTTMEKMFHKCNNLVTIIGLKYFDTSSVTSMSQMFDSCSSLKCLDLGNFNTSKVTDMGGMFKDCSSLKELNIAGFDTSGLKYQPTNMFKNCDDSIIPDWYTNWGQVE